ncbi:MAG: NAD(P)H-dependent oxidoreductase [Pseudomonadota bacterium]|nr:NAD(P)H-dependent oxidoreductase [Pseudomonadota bacterium]
MATKQILIIQGHPDSSVEHLGYRLAEAYVRGAQQAGHHLEQIEVATLDFPVLRSEDEWKNGDPAADIRAAQQALRRATHIVIFYPLWLGGMPALLKAFLEQLLRPGFAFQYGKNGSWHKDLHGRSARVVVTMGMPGLVYRWFYRAHTLRSLVRNILAFTGIGPTRTEVVGMVEAMPPARLQRLLARMEALGRQGV